VLLEDAHSLKALYRGALACHKLHDYHVAMGLPAMGYLLRTAAPTVRPRPPSSTRPSTSSKNRLPEICMSSLKSARLHAPLNVRLSERNAQTFAHDPHTSVPTVAACEHCTRCVSFRAVVQPRNRPIALRVYTPAAVSMTPLRSIFHSH
jgi:hypothetical protein